VDAVLLDHIIAQRALARTPGGGFVIQLEPVAVGRYVACSRAPMALRDSVNAALAAAMRDGPSNDLPRVARGIPPRRRCSPALGSPAEHTTAARTWAKQWPTSLPCCAPP
jgi:hypothetical protein